MIDGWTNDKLLLPIFLTSPYCSWKINSFEQSNLCFLGQSGDAEKLSFSWLENKSGLPILNVKFPDNGRTAKIYLKRYEPFRFRNEKADEKKNCIFEGRLENELDSQVMVTGACPFENNFEVFYLDT